MAESEHVVEPPLKKKKFPSVLASCSIRNPSFFYLYLSLVSNQTGKTPLRTIDELTARAHLTSSLSQFLGVTGTAIAIDILKCEGPNVWIRVPSEDSSVVTEAVSGWVGNDVAWRIRASGNWLGSLVAGDGRDLFELHSNND